MSRETRSKTRGRPTPFTVGIYGRELSMPIEAFDFHKCMKSTKGDVIFIDSRNRQIDRNVIPHVMYDSMTDVMKHPGIYTWLLVKNYAGAVYFVAAKTLTSSEILSKHRDLYFWAREPLVLAAGECEIRRGGHVVYNFESGTFMVDMMKSYAAQYPETNFNVTYTPTLNAMWSSAGAVTVHLVKHSLIRTMSDSILDSLLREYERAGYIVYKFPTERDCNVYRNWPLIKARIQGIRDTFSRSKIDEPFESWLARMYPQYVDSLTEPAAPVHYFSEGGRRLRTRVRTRTRRTHRRRQV